MGLFDLSDSGKPLAIDASVTINLSACGIGGDISRFLKPLIIVADVVGEELLNDPPPGRDDAGQLRSWIDQGIIKEVCLASIDSDVFLDLVAGSASETLDDGEAATIALAISASAVAVIDERKANRICSERYPELQLASTTDLLLHESVLAEFDEGTIANALFAALIGARMRVLPHHLERVVALLGPQRAARCISLPRSLRELPQTRR